MSGRAAAIVAALLLSACGGRVELVPVHQIGRFSDDAVVANAAGVRLVVRTAAWPGPANEFSGTGIIPLELTVDNGSMRELQVRHRDVSLVTGTGEPMGSIAVADLPRWRQADRAAVAPPVQSMQEKALPEGAIAPGGRVTGFVYFPTPADVDEVTLRFDLVDAATDARFGAITIPFWVE